MKPAARAAGQNAGGASSYSTAHTALPAAVNGRSRPHSRYWKHCSISAQSKSRSSSAACSRSFLSAMVSPRACAAARQEAVEAQLVDGAQREPRVVGVAVDIVGLDAVETLARAEVEPALEHRAEHVERADVEPALARPALERLPFDRGGERAGSGRPASREPALK